MPASSTPRATNIKVFVEWDESPVYAGEDVKCKITFTNVASPPAPDRQRTHLNHHPSANGSPDSTDRRPSAGRGDPSRPHAKSNASQNARFASQATRGHRQSMSLSVPRSAGPSQAQFGLNHAQPSPPIARGHKHQRSVSIISLGGGSEAGGGDVHGSGGGRGADQPQRNHSRSASIQPLPKRAGVANGGLTFPGLSNRPHPRRSPAAYSPSVPGASDSPRIGGPDVTAASGRPAGSMVPPKSPDPTTVPGGPSTTQLRSFRFPPDSTLDPRHGVGTDGSASRTRAIDGLGLWQPAPHEPLDPSPLEHAPAITDAMSASSVNEATPRSSGELFSLSNHSTETLMSDYRSHLQHRPRGGTPLVGAVPTRMSPRAGPAESLMMGYAQIMGSFTLDGSLVNQAPFDEIKRKAVISGHGGGGVVGVGTRPSGGLFGSLGWGQIGESLGGLLGTGEPSSLREMKGEAKAKAIPLLRTPQSVLFVDLRLAPNESKAYHYRFPMPKGLPPSHRGRAIRISYQLVVGTQRAATASRPQQQSRQVEIPFRVFGGVNGQGELLGHDLLSPRLILTDDAQTASVGVDQPPPSGTGVKDASPPKADDSGLRDLMAFVGDLMSHPDSGCSTTLLSPTEPHHRGSFTAGPPASVKDSIDLAILRSNVLPASSRRANRFEIARNGRRVATISLARSAYRLGETVIAAVDVSGADVPCYAFRATLETTEAVDASIALRSAASVDRVTRRVHASQTESTLFARRVVCAFVVPLQATPTFTTSGVSVAWTLRIEFVASRLQLMEEPEDEAERGEQLPDGTLQLLEEVSSDERGSISASVETLRCESFDVAIPLRVYGPVSNETGPEASTTESWFV